MRVGLFCGQSAIDLALLRNGEIARPADVLEDVRELAGSVDLLVIKPHPYEPDLRHLIQLAAQIPNAAWTDANIYALLCAENLKFICGLSSGTLHEARYFMKPSRHLLTPDRNNRSCLPAACSDWISVGPGIASLEGLATVCSHAFERAPRPSRFPDDALDRVFGARWGLDAHSSGLPALPVLALNRPYEFSAGQAATAWLSLGWHAPEGTGVWTAGERACIVIPLDAGTDTTHPLSVHIEGRLFVGASPRNPIIRISINGQRSDAQAAGGVSGETDARLKLSVRWEDAKKARVLVLEFDVTDPQRPCDAGLGSNDRRLGFHLQRLALRPGAAPVIEETPARAHRTLRMRHAGRRTAKVWIAAMASVGVFGTAFLQASTGEPAPQEVATSQWIHIKHAVASGTALVCDDIRRLLSHHI